MSASSALWCRERSDLAECLAGVNMTESDPGAMEELVAASRRLDALAAGGAQQTGAFWATKRPMMYRCACPCFR